MKFQVKNLSKYSVQGRSQGGPKVSGHPPREIFLHFARVFKLFGARAPPSKISGFVPDSVDIQHMQWLANIFDSHFFFKKYFKIKINDLF